MEKFRNDVADLIHKEGKAGCSTSKMAVFFAQHPEGHKYLTAAEAAEQILAS